MNKFLIILFAFCNSGLALAGHATGRVSSIFVADDSSVVLFMLTTEINGSPRCNETQRFSINLRKPGGMATYMAILEAKKQDYEISVDGLNTCTNEWKSEDIKNIILN